MIRLWAGLSWVHFPSEASDCSLHSIETISEAHTASCSMGIGGLFLGVCAPKALADHIIPSSGEVKNEWRRTYTSCMCLCGEKRDNVTFTFTVKQLTRFWSCYCNLWTVIECVETFVIAGHHHHFLLLLVEHRASMKSFQALQTPAIPLTSFHDLPVFLISSSVVLRHVPFGLPLLIYP